MTATVNLRVAGSLPPELRVPCGVLRRSVCNTTLVRETINNTLLAPRHSASFSSLLPHPSLICSHPSLSPISAPPRLWGRTQAQMSYFNTDLCRTKAVIVLIGMLFQLKICPVNCLGQNVKDK